MGEGATGSNIGRLATIRAGLPYSVPGATISRACASGLNAIAVAAGRIVLDREQIVVAGGVESISLVQPVRASTAAPEQWLQAKHSAIYMPMNDTAEIVAKRYGITREEIGRASCRERVCQYV